MPTLNDAQAVPNPAKLARVARETTQRLHYYSPTETHAMTIKGLFRVLALLLLGFAGSTVYAETPYPYGSSRDWTSSRADSPYHGDYRHKPGYQNGNAGYIGSDLPPSEYQPDSRSREYQREKVEPMPPVDGKAWTPDRNRYCTNRPLCGGGD